MWLEKFKKNLKERLDIFFRYFRIYAFYFIVIILVSLICICVENRISNIHAVFESQEEVVSEDRNDVRNETIYNYFLDFSPSMQGFLYEDLNVGMKNIADNIGRINAGNEKNYFYWCRDTIESVAESSVFYDSMKTEVILTNYYERIVRNNILPQAMDEEQIIDEERTVDSEIDEVINNIDLSGIFTRNYIGTVENGSDTLNVIITDLNFFKDANDLEGHNEKILRFASRLGQRVENANICVYAINSDYAGTANDAFTAIRGNNTSAIFYVIIFSDNDVKYNRYCQQFENDLTLELVQGKYELLNHINSGAELKIDLDLFNSLDLIINENLNFANEIFDNLDNNEFGLQAVTLNTSRGRLAMPVSEIDLSGYYSADTVGLDDTIIDTEIEMYQNKGRDDYKAYEDTSMIMYQNAGLYYEPSVTNEPGKWFLRVDLELNTHPVALQQGQQSRIIQWLLGGLQREYIILNLKFYMKEPSYSKPQWISEVGYSNILNDDVIDIESVINEIIRYKKSAYILQPKTERYLGNTVIYILY